MKVSPPNGLRGSGRDQVLGWNTHIHRCPWCRKKRNLTHLELYSIDGFSAELRAYRLDYPRPEKYVVAVVAHTDCGPCVGDDLPGGYAFPLDELAADPNRWYRHLLEKIWAPPYLADVIYDALLLHRKSAYHRFHPREVRATVQQTSSCLERARSLGKLPVAYEYRLAGGLRMIMIASAGMDLAGVRQRLENRFGADQVLEVRLHTKPEVER